MNIFGGEGKKPDVFFSLQNQLNNKPLVKNTFPLKLNDIIWHKPGTSVTSFLSFFVKVTTVI